MFDTHCHLDAEEYDCDRREVLARARARGLRGIMVPGYEPTEWRGLGALCASDPLLSCAVGLHPWYVHELDARARAEALAALPDVIRAQGARAVGEFGLDAVKAKRGGAPIELQKEVVARHLEVARELSLPVIVHCVRAHGAMLELLERYRPLPRGGVMHSYGGPVELIDRYAKHGMYFSYAGVVVREAAHKNRATLARVPLDRLLVESDGPDQAAWAGPGGRSEPCDILRVLEVAARLREEPFEVLCEAVTDNAEALFALP